MSAPATTVVAGLGFPEAPRWHDGRLWFSDQALGAVFTLDSGGGLERQFDVPGRPSGLGWSPDGTLLVVSMERRLLLAWRGGALDTVADLSGHATFHANDMVVDGAGRAYIGNFGSDYRQGEDVRPATLVRVDPDGRVVAAARELVFPNGLALTEDGRVLVVAETYGQRLTAFDVASDGSLSGRRVFADLPGVYPDGICLDAEGAAWVAAANRGEAIRVRQGGEVCDSVATGRRGAYAVMLGGDDLRTLFICCAGGANPIRNERQPTAEIQRVNVEVPGAGLP